MFIYKKIKLVNERRTGQRLFMIENLAVKQPIFYFYNVFVDRMKFHGNHLSLRISRQM